MSWTYIRRVKYYETDRMGVVHHSNYLRILEDARMDWMDNNIMRYGDIEKMGIIVPAVAAEEKFKGFLRFDDEFAVKLKLVEYTGVKMVFTYEIHNTANGQLCYEAKTTHFFSEDGNQPGKTYKPMSIKRRFPELHEKMLSLLEKEQ